MWTEVSEVVPGPCTMDTFCSLFCTFSPKPGGFLRKEAECFRRARLPESAGYLRVLMNLGKSVCTDCFLGLSFEVLQTAPSGPFL